MVNVVRVATVNEVCRAAAAEFVRVVREVSKTGGKHGDGCARVVLTGGGCLSTLTSTGSWCMCFSGMSGMWR